MIKYMGILMLSSSFALYGSIKSNQIKQSLAMRKAIVNLLHSVENGIRYGAVDKNRIYSRFSDECLERCGFLDLLREGDISLQSVDNSLNLLSKSERIMIYGFFSKLGKSGRSDCEINNCKAFISEFEVAVQQAEKNLGSKIMLYKKLGIICALALVVIFV